MIRTTIISEAVLLAIAIAGAGMARADDIPTLNKPRHPEKGVGRIWHFRSAWRASRASGNSSQANGRPLSRRRRPAASERSEALCRATPASSAASRWRATYGS